MERSNLIFTQDVSLSIGRAIHVIDSEILAAINHLKFFWIHQDLLGIIKSIWTNHKFPYVIKNLMKEHHRVSKANLSKKFLKATQIECLEVAYELAVFEKLFGSDEMYTMLKDHIIKVCCMELGINSSGHHSPGMPYFNPSDLIPFRQIYDKTLKL